MLNQVITVLSVFDGISGVQIALKQLGYKVKCYASEIDEYAINIAQKNHPETIQLGDVKLLNETNLPKDIDLLIGGFPCQDLSTAKKDRKGLDGEQSQLFWEFKRILDYYSENQKKPFYFVGENVESMKTKDYVIITNALGVEPIMLNAALVSAQRRKRYFWTNIPNVKQPEMVKSRICPNNKIGLVIADILEENAERRIINVPKERIIKTSYGIRWNVNKISQSNAQATTEKDFLILVDKDQQQNRASEVTEKSRTLTNLTSRTFIDNKSSGSSEPHRAIEPHKKHSTLVGSRLGSKCNVVTDIASFTIECLTWVEIERLAGLPDNYTLLDKNNGEKRGKSIGNGFQIDILRHLLTFMKGFPKPIERSKTRVKWEQQDLFE